MLTKKFKFNLGKTASDKLTGFKGLVTGQARYITGCDQFLVQPTELNDGAMPKGLWFDEGRLKELNEKRISKKSVESRGKGACGVAPSK